MSDNLVPSNEVLQQDSKQSVDESKDFWAMSGDVITRYHRSPRQHLYTPQESDFPIPLKYVDVHRHTETDLDSPSEH